jgi:DNA invertase Pin-like site-specific DNA recombinase
MKRGRATPVDGRRAVLLGRVSRGERQQDPESQLAPLRAAAARLGWVVVEEVALKMSAWDEASAAEVRRKALAPIVAGRADTLVVWALDRVCRGGIEAAFSLLGELEEHLGADLFSLQEPFLSTATADRQSRELMVAMLSWVAKWESQRKSERLKAKVQSKRAKAEQLGQRALWGRGRLATNQDAARVRELSAAGQSVRKIAAETGLSKSQVQRLLATAA